MNQTWEHTCLYKANINRPKMRKRQQYNNRGLQQATFTNAHIIQTEN